eukprot:scaffold20361_cov102-Isochrysis_galbana.AAC.10
MTGRGEAGARPRRRRRRPREKRSRRSGQSRRSCKTRKTPLQTRTRQSRTPWGQLRRARPRCRSAGVWRPPTRHVPAPPVRPPARVASARVATEHRRGQGKRVRRAPHAHTSKRRLRPAELASTVAAEPAGCGARDLSVWHRHRAKRRRAGPPNLRPPLLPAPPWPSGRAEGRRAPVRSPPRPARACAPPPSPPPPPPRRAPGSAPGVGWAT